MKTIVAACLSAGLLSALSVHAQTPGKSAAGDYPNRPIRLVVPFPAGGTPDSNARTLFGQMERQLGQNIVVDNRSGANGMIGMETVAHAAPDGYTFLYTTVAFVINPSVYKKLPYDVKRDYVPVTNVANGLGYIIVVNSGVPAQSLKEFIALGKSRDKPLSYGTPGIGNSQHVAGELFNLKAGTVLQHVPYKGVAPAMNALLGGEVQAMFMPPTVAVQHIKSGRLRPLAYTAAKRWNQMPDVPTAMEAGVAGYEFAGAWHGIFAPAKTPAPIVARFQQEAAKAMAVPKVKEFFVAGGYEPVTDTPEHFAKFVDAELKAWAELARIAKLKAE